MYGATLGGLQGAHLAGGASGRAEGSAARTGGAGAPTPLAVTLCVSLALRQIDGRRTRGAIRRHGTAARATLAASQHRIIRCMGDWSRERIRDRAIGASSIRRTSSQHAELSLHRREPRTSTSTSIPQREPTRRAQLHSITISGWRRRDHAPVSPARRWYGARARRRRNRATGGKSTKINDQQNHRMTRLAGHRVRRDHPDKTIQGGVLRVPGSQIHGDRATEAGRGKARPRDVSSRLLGAAPRALLEGANRPGSPG